MGRRQYTVSNDAHRLAHRCFTIRVRRHPLCQGRTNGVARGRLGERGFQLVRCRARPPSLAIRVGITRSVTSDRYVVVPSSWQPLCLFQSDSTTTLYAVLHASGKTPAMNALAAEIALRLECANVFTVPEHVAGRLNFDSRRGSSPVVVLVGTRCILAMVVAEGAVLGGLAHVLWVKVHLWAYTRTQ